MVKAVLSASSFLFSTSAAFSQLRRDARRSSLISEATTAIGDSITLLLESSYLKRFEPTEITSLVSAVTAAVRARQHSSSHKETIASMLKGVASRVASSDLLLTSMAAALEEQKSNGYSSRAWEGGITVEEMELVRRSSCCSRRTSHRPPSEPSLRIRTSSSWTSPATWQSS